MMDPEDAKAQVRAAQAENASRGQRIESTDRQQHYSRKYRDERRLWLWSFKRRPCTDCKVQYPPYVMHFDHLPGCEKKFNISQALHRSKAEIIEEIAKCELVCGNCHAVRTFERFMQGKFDAFDAPANEEPLWDDSEPSWAGLNEEGPTNG